MNNRFLTLDASNRAWRTFLQALVLEIGIQVVPVIYDALQDTSTNYDWNWLQSVVRLVGMTAISFVMRRYLDPIKGLPTPLPPEYPGEPSDETGSDPIR